jgi:hypothetical protein
MLLWYCLVLLYCTVHDSGVSANASRVGPRLGKALAVAELEGSVLILTADGAAEDMFLSVLDVKGVSSRARLSPRVLVVDREWLSVGHGHFRQHFRLMKASWGWRIGGVVAILLVFLLAFNMSPSMSSSSRSIEGRMISLSGCELSPGYREFLFAW